MGKAETYFIDFVIPFGFLFFNFRDLEGADLAVNQPSNSQSANEDNFELSSKDNL